MVHCDCRANRMNPVHGNLPDLFGAANGRAVPAVSSSFCVASSLHSSAGSSPGSGGPAPRIPPQNMRRYFFVLRLSHILLHQEKLEKIRDTDA